MTDIDHRSPLAPGTVVGGYQIERLLGTGGFALTYLGRPRGGGEQVVIKEYAPLDIAERADDRVALKPISGSETAAWRQALTAFVTEAQALASLGHPAIVPVIRFFRENGTAYLVMPFVKGRPLHDLIDRAPAGMGLGADRLMAVANQLLGALEEMHGRGILHRDIKPDNVLVEDQGGDRLRAMLIDFGSARIGDAARRDPMRGFGSPGYAAPEQYSSRSEQGPWTDVYGLGALLYHGVTGRMPPAADDRRRGTEMEPAATAGQPFYPKEFLRAIDDALDLDPGLRPQSAAEFRASMAGSRIQSRRRRARARARWLRHWRVGAAALAGTAAVAAWFVFSGDPSPTGPPPPGNTATWKPGDRFRDCDDCPFMTVVPAAAIPADAPAALRERFTTIRRPFAIGIHEVTRAEYAAFAAATRRLQNGGCRTQVKDGIWRLAPKAGWQAPGIKQTPTHPVVCVSWDDARAFVRWLAERTGQPYRLPTAAEWEYAARAGGLSAYAWGDAPGGACQGCRPGATGTAAAGAFPANRFGLHDVHGNAAEWVQDCAAARGERETGCRKRLVRGGHWASPPKDLAFTARGEAFPDLRNNRTGFRVVRDLP